MTNPNPNARKNIKPGLQVPTGLPPEMEKFLQAVKEHLQGADGTKGQPLERFVTLSDLERIGLIKTGVKNGRGIITGLNQGDSDGDSNIGVTELSELNDVRITGQPADGSLLAFDIASRTWGPITISQLTVELDVFTDTTPGIVPASGGGEANFLRADGTWAEVTSGAILLYVNSAHPTGDTVANLDVETELVSQYTIEADTLLGGALLHIRLAGLVSTHASGDPDLTLRIYFGETAFVVVGPIDLPTSLTDVGWTVDVWVTVHSVGATAEFDVQGVYVINDAPGHIVTTTLFEEDTTVDLPITVSAQWSEDETGNSVSLRQMTVFKTDMNQPAPTISAIDPDEVEDT